MLLTQEVEVKLNSKNVEHYKNLGYDIPMRPASESYRKIYHKDYVYDFKKTIVVKVEHLTKGSSVPVQVLCDYCKKEVMTMTYYTYLNSIKTINKNSCNNCKGKKEAEYFILKYGVKNPSLLEENIEKYRLKCLSKYGVDHYFKTDEFKHKKINSMQNKYGVNYPLQSKEIQENCRNTCLNKYGVDNPAKSQCVKDKIKKTNINKYGGNSPSHSEKIREKITQTFYKNSSQKSSSQQIYICNLYKGILNYPLKHYNVDIYLSENSLICEYDGSGHSLNVRCGRETLKEHNHKEIIRNNVIKREGYKQMRIISSTDKLPTDEILLQMLEYAKQYFSDYPNHSWIEFNIDSSTVRDAEQKEGSYFNYGDLRRIKKSDIKEQSEITNCA